MAFTFLQFLIFFTEYRAQACYVALCFYLFFFFHLKQIYSVSRLFQLEWFSIEID